MRAGNCAYVVENQEERNLRQGQADRVVEETHVNGLSACRTNAKWARTDSMIPIALPDLEAAAKGIELKKGVNFLSGHVSTVLLESTIENRMIIFMIGRFMTLLLKGKNDANQGPISKERRSFYTRHYGSDT